MAADFVIVVLEKPAKTKDIRIQNDACIGSKYYIPTGHEAVLNALPKDVEEELMSLNDSDFRNRFQELIEERKLQGLFDKAERRYRRYSSNGYPKNPKKQTNRQKFRNYHFRDRTNNLPYYMIGEVSWLKAALFNDDKFVPGPIDKIGEIIGETFPKLTQQLIEKILQACDVPDNSHYNVSVNKEKLRAFLESHKGKKVFTESW